MHHRRDERDVRKRKKEEKKERNEDFALPYSFSVLSNEQRGWSRALTVIHVVKLIIKSGNGAPSIRYESGYVVYEAVPRRGTGRSSSAHSQRRGRSLGRESGIPGVTHTAPSPRRGDEASSIYKCGSTWLRGRLVSSLLRVRAETVVNPPSSSSFSSSSPFSAPSRESDRLIEISLSLGGSVIGPMLEIGRSNVG